MLDYRHHQDDDLSLSCRKSSVDDKRDLRLDSVSSHTSVDSDSRPSKPTLSPTIQYCPPDADEDSDCDSDASGEYEPLRESASRMSARSISPPPPLPPPRPRCNSLNATRPSTSSSSSTMSYFTEPPQASRSLGDLNGAPTEPAPVAGRKNFSRYLAVHTPISPRRLSLLWRRKSERVRRIERAIDGPDELLNTSLPNLTGGTPAVTGAGAAALAVPERGAVSLAGTPRSASPSRMRVSPGALHRALRRTMRRSRGHKNTLADSAQDMTSGGASASQGAVEERQATPSPLRSEGEASSSESPASFRKRVHPVTGRRRVSFDSTYFQFPGNDITKQRLGRSLPEPIDLPSPVYELIVDPPAPSIVIDCPEDAPRDQGRRGDDSPERQAQGEDDDGYMTMDSMQAILRSPPPGLLHVPDPDLVTPDPVFPEQESDYLDMAGILKLRQTFAASLTSSQVKLTPPARPPRKIRDEKFVSAGNISADNADYANLSELRHALQALQETSGPTITEDE